MTKVKNYRFFLHLLGIIVGSLIFFISSHPAYCQSNYYYYLQVGSFKTVPEARLFSKQLNAIHESELIRGEDIPKLGYWFRVYLGPFSSFKQASQKRLELRKKGFYAEHAFVHKKKSLIQSNVEKEEMQIAQHAQSAPEHAAQAESPVKPDVKIAPKEQKSFKQAPSDDCVKNCYYYLQVGSFNTASQASTFAHPLNALSEKVVINGEDIPDLGHRYRVYLGPYMSFQAASQKRIELRKKGFYAKDAFVHKKKSLIPTGMQAETELPQEKALTVAEMESAEAAPQKQAAVMTSESEKEPVAAEEKVTAATQPPTAEKMTEETPSSTQEKTTAEPGLDAESPDQKEPSAMKKEAAAAPSMSMAAAADSTPKPDLSTTVKRGKGRNVAKGAFALGLNHTYLKTETELTNRKLITSNGTTTTTQNVSLASIDQNALPTAMHITTIRARFGLTDWMEIFADVGGAYNKLSDPEAAYGGGARINLFEVPVRKLGDFYLALQGEYLGGKYKEEYDTSSGTYRWSKESDWQKFSGKVELGITRSKFTVYIGGLYFLYDEDTDRTLLQNIPSPNISYIQQDELEQEYNYGAFGGVSYHITPAWLLNIEGQYLHQKSISVAIEYLF